ncbi:MAG: PcfJ domain-containing protein, partial [Erysipelotrichaceae bacterium]
MKKTIQPKLTIEEVVIEIPDIPQLACIGYDEMPHYLFRKDGFYYCGHCGHRFGKAILNASPDQCPLCQTPYVLKQITSRTNYRNLETHIFAHVMQKFEGRIVKRDYMIRHYVENVKERVSIDEVERETIYRGQWYQHRKYPVREDRDYFKNYISSAGKWIEGYFSINDYEFRMKKYFDFYPDSFEEFLRDTDLRYSGVGLFTDKKHGKNSGWYAMMYMREATRYPWVEYLSKLGMTNLYEEVISLRTDHRYIRAESVRKYVKFIRENNACTRHVIIYRMFEKIGFKLNFADVELISDRANALKIIEMHKATCMSPPKIIRYVQEEKNEEIGCGSSRHLNYTRLDKYVDYIDMMVKIKTIPDNNLLAFPKDLEDAHDKAVGKFNAMKFELETNTYKEIVLKLLKLEFEDSGLEIRVPRSLEEILEEGKTLHHCVGSYVDRVIARKTVIVFVRRKEHPNTPYYTVEYRDGRVVQFYPLRDKITPDRPVIESFLNEWQEWIKNPKK